VLCLVATILAVVSRGEPHSAWLLAGSVLYLVGTILVTIRFNVPRNEALRRVAPLSADAAPLPRAISVDDMFWGDRYGIIEDPFGHHWSIATHIRDVKPEDLSEAMRNAASSKPAG
jgi:Domain of unknown function (DUF1772)